MKRISAILFFAISCSFGCGGNAESKGTSSEGDLPPGKTSGSEQKSDLLKNKGIGPIESMDLGEIDSVLAEEGKKLYNSMCSACHQIEQDYIGPSPKGIFERRSPEWIMNMILNPSEMIKKDPIAIKLLEDANGVPMANQGLTEEEARNILEYFRTL